MKKKFIIFAFLILISCGKADNVNQNVQSGVKDQKIIKPGENTVKKRYEMPEGYARISYAEDSFSYYLQNFHLKKYGSLVYYFDGREKPNKVHDSILDIDVGTQDLQQCADAIMRLRAEYLFNNKRYKEISFNFVNGFEANFDKWASGYRVVNNSDKSSWVKKGGVDYSYENYRKFMNIVFSYANTYSLDKQLKAKDLKEISPGDVFIKPGFPGHAIIVMDVAENKAGNRIFLLAQSYMPAQDIHVLKNYNNEKISPWYSVEEIGGELKTPEWNFTVDQFKSF